MELQLLECDEKHVKVLLRDLNRSYANALRRFAISEVPTMAVDDVVIIENSSVMYDEMIAHRLGMIPLKTDLSRYVLPEECDCKSSLGCPRCRVLLVLDAEARDKVKTVYSGDLVSEDDFVKPIADNIPILKLAPGQKIKLEAYARLGRGRENAKWQPASVSVLLPVNGKEDEFTLLVESVGSLPAWEIVLKAAGLLSSKLSELAERSKSSHE